MSATKMALIPLEHYQSFCATIRHCLGTTEPITSGQAYWMLLDAIRAMESNEDWLISGGQQEEYANDRVQTIRSYGFNQAPGPVVAKFPFVTQIGNNAFLNNRTIEQACFPAAKTLGSNMFQGADALRLVDLGHASAIQLNTFADAASLQTVILRKSNGIMSLGGLTAFRGTPFAEGGAGGGKVYVPSALIETYKTATNWSVLYSYGTFEFVPLEGSEYE